MPISAPNAASQELRKETSSYLNHGRPIQLGRDLTTATDVTVVHAPTDEKAIDKVELVIWNNDDEAIEVSLVISPDDYTDSADVAAASITFTAPAKQPLELPSFFVRYDGSTPYAIAAYVATADLNKASITAHFTRLAQGELTP